MSTQPGLNLLEEIRKRKGNGIKKLDLSTKRIKVNEQTNMRKKERTKSTRKETETLSK